MGAHHTKTLGLSEHLFKLGFKEQSRYLNYLIKISEGIAGTDFPVEDTEEEGVDNAIRHLEQNPGIPIYLDNPAGTRKGFGAKKKIKLPFHYGEFTGLVNPSDDMYWDLIIVPSQSEDGVNHFKAGHAMTPIGYAPVNPDEETWSEMTKKEGHETGKKPPLGNDKIIIAALDGYSDEDMVKDKEQIEKFFDKLWQFEKIKWLL